MTEGIAPASGAASLLWLLIALPALSAAVLLLTGRLTDRWGHYLGVLTPLVSFGLAAAMFAQMLGSGPQERSVRQQLFTWIPLGDYQVDVALQLDQLSMCFVLLITGVGSLIHIYSIGYMTHDPRRRRFFGYLNLFVAAMLLLVLADDFLVMFVGWEGVGLASYLLIGFWQHKHSAATAAKKAFVVNRVGDVGFLLALLVLIATFGSTSFQVVFAGAGNAEAVTMTVVGLLLLLGACGKSAQFPLQSWLLDAMEGPTPVSALIHAATMVTAGVYLVTRANAIYAESEVALTAVMLVGTVTLLMGALIGCAKDDIKKVLAASTMSQIGYMMLAAGLGPIGYTFAIFHLLTHGFFKANMFLGAGSVMHATNDNVNMRVFGALRKVMPLTFLTFGVGYLAIIGIPPFAGFFSKDSIIAAAFGHNVWVGLCALIGAGVTAFYMTRLMLMTYFGTKRWESDVHPHESPPVMTFPLLALGVLSVIGGLWLAYVGGGITDFLEPVVGYEEAHAPISHMMMQVLTVVVALLGVGVAWAFFGRRAIPTTAPAGSPVTVLARNDLYADAFNEAVLMRPGEATTKALVTVDDRGVDGVVNGVAAFVGGLSSVTRKLTTGFVRSYALVMLGGAAAVVATVMLVRL